MNLIIDIGNTRTKTAVFNNDTIVEQQILNRLKIADIVKLLQLFPWVDKCIISNVGKPKPGLIQYLQKNLFQCIELTGNISLPFTNLYKSKSTQGTDRIAAIAGAWSVFKGNNVLIIDSGTAIKFDFIDSSGIYKGGNISPGIDIRFKSLHNFTQRLPLLNKKEIGDFLGTNTDQAIISGVLNGIVFEIKGYISTLQKEFKNLKVVVTGGGAAFLADKIKNIIFEEFLVEIGLNSILEHNVKRL